MISFSLFFAPIVMLHMCLPRDMSRIMMTIRIDNKKETCNVNKIYN